MEDEKRMNEQAGSIEAQIDAVQQRLTEARARIPAHSTPAALMAEIDDLEVELERLKRVQAQDEIADLERRLAEASARVPKHDIPPALMTEIDEIEERLAQLRAGQ
jgi:DNA repair exonuclease SbcCD ATPase subunit